MQVMHSRWAILTLATLWLAGCSGDPAPTGQRAPAEPVIAIGPPASAPAPSGSDSATSTAKPESALSPHARTDGRPAWWIDQPQTASGRVYLAVEALGMDVRSARRAAVDSGIDTLTRMLGHDPADDRVHATTVRPLPHRGGANEGMRYIGYVLVSAESPGAG